MQALQTGRVGRRKEVIEVALAEWVRSLGNEKDRDEANCRAWEACEV